MTSSTKSLYTGRRFPPELISDTVWLYFRFPLSLRMVEGLDRPRGQQQPFQGVVPDAHARHPDQRAARRTVARRQKLQVAPGHADDRFALSGQNRGRTHRAGCAQRRQRSAARNQPSVLGRPHDRIPAGLPDALEMLEDVGAPVRNRDEEAVRRRTADRRDRFGPDR
jgi:hypothetical protein